MITLSNTLEVSRKLRYATLATDSVIDHVVYLLHGYGQLVEFFIRKLDGIELSKTLIVAPEGMHRFYLNGTSGRVGASWMTREWRENDIEENNRALDQLHSHILEQIHPTTISVVGFSQGGATAARWVVNGNLNCTHFISWASVFPPDVSPESLKELNCQSSFVVGTQDPFFSNSQLAEVLSTYHHLNFNCITFEGKHDIDRSLLSKILSA